MQAERALYSARLDLQQRNRSLNLARGSAQREADSAASQSLLSRLTSSSPAAAHLKSLEVEVSAMESVERQMVKDVATLKRRKMMRELGRSWKGRMWLLVGWLFSLYCVWRVFVVSIASLPILSDSGSLGESCPLSPVSISFLATLDEATNLRKSRTIPARKGLISSLLC